MCGIVGVVEFKNSISKNELKEMTKTLTHRGPNDTGIDIYNNTNFNIGFGQTRLSIIDITSAGHQPMNYKHLSIVFNGEVYNYKEIRKELISLGHNFISNSDTEVVLHSFLEWGKKCVLKFIGMFAFAILDRSIQKIILFKDRAGIKPLYYYFKNDVFMFSSELKAFHKHSKFIKELNNNAVQQYMDFGFVPSPNCIFNFCNKLNGGCLLVFDLKNKSKLVEKYWDVNSYYQLPRLDISYENAKIELKKILKSAFNYRMVSDVPVGVFLSGGYDSSAVAAILQNGLSSKLKTFTIGFNDGNNEAVYAKQIANYLGTDHSEFYCDTKNAQEILHQLPEYYDEPFADSSAIPTILVSKLAVKSVTVALSADGGDETFAGYDHYKKFNRILNIINKIPKQFRIYLISLIHFNLKLPISYRIKQKLNISLKLLNSNDSHLPSTLYAVFYQLRTELKNNLFKNEIYDDKKIYNNTCSGFSDNTSLSLANDYKFYLQNDILTKVDRATMSVSLEGREPLLDHRIIEFAAQLPLEFKYGKSQKYILKDIVHDYIPKKLMDRPKSGFSIPLDNWIKNDMSEYVKDNLSNENIKSMNLFNSKFIQNYKEDFFNNNKIENSTVIWRLLQFQLWHKKWM